MVIVGTGTSGTRFINRDYPNTDGITAGTTTQEGHEEYLVPEEKSLVQEIEKKGL